MRLQQQIVICLAHGQLLQPVRQPPTVVDPAATAWATRSADPIPVKSRDAEANTSGETNTNDDINGSHH